MTLELLAPAGNLDKLKIAFHYGADACYLGGKLFSLRARADNFSDDDMYAALEYARMLEKRIYVTMNIFMRNKDTEQVLHYAEFLATLGVDAVIVSDPGVCKLVKQVAPLMEIHVSTQANVTNWAAAERWVENGATRIILARELSLEEIAGIHERCPQVELEAFVHGAMCMSYSGRCLLSNYMTGRDANRGDCSQPCRYKYVLMEEKREGEYFPVYEDENGTFIMNSRDLCMVRHIPEMVKAGICSFKIEGRMKGLFYSAVTTRAYRTAIDAYLKNADYPAAAETSYKELEMVSHRQYDTGFFFDPVSECRQVYGGKSYIRENSVLGMILEPAGEYYKFLLANELSTGSINLYTTDGIHTAEITEIVSEDGRKHERLAGDFPVYVRLEKISAMQESLRMAVAYL